MALRILPSLPLAGALGALALLLCPPALGETADGALQAAPVVSEAVGFMTVTVEGRTLEVRMRTRGDAREIDAAAIFKTLRGEVTLDGTLLRLKRFQDGARLSIDMSEGKVRSGEVVLGKLPGWTPREAASTWLEVNAIAVLTGCQVSEDAAGNLTLTLDDRLRPKFDLDLWIDARPVDVDPADAPRTMGPVLLVPLRPVTEAFGHGLEVDPVTGRVTVTRIQDAALISLEPATGLVTVNGQVAGVSPNLGYAEVDRLLFPSDAVETLTGTHIRLAPGTRRVEVSLDKHLEGAALPGQRIDDEAATTPLTPERLDVQVSDRGPAIAVLSAHVRGWNTSTRYESAGAITVPEQLAPRWLATEITSMQGWRATIGDATPKYRQLAGADAARIRGATFVTARPSGTLLAIAAGIPVDGAETVGENASVPTFGGFAAGVRLIDPKRRREIALAIADDAAGGSRAVASYQGDFSRPRNDAGLSDLFVAADIGVFEEGADIRGRADARYRLGRTSSLSASLSHDGARFLDRTGGDDADQADEDKTGLAANDHEGVFGERVSARTRASLSADWRAADNWGIVRTVAAGARVSAVMAGEARSQTVSLNASGRIGARGPDLAVSAGLSSSTGADGESASGHTLGLRAFQRLRWGDLQAQYIRSGSDTGETTQRLVANARLHPVRRAFANGVSVTLAPTLGALFTDDTRSARLGAALIADSGAALGERLKLNGQLSALQSFDEATGPTDLFANAAARYRLGRHVEIEARYTDTFDGNRDLAIALRGAIVFNPPRRHGKALQGRGVLRGRVFLDRNRDGIRQKDEPGIPGAGVRVRGTPLKLRVDNTGHYTIQNLKTGLYELALDVRSLPLGMIMPDAADPKATIGDGRITVLDIPVVASGQVRGTLFIDANVNDALDAGETRIEGEWLRLIALDGEAEPLERHSASFGQFAFENVPPGFYRLEASHDGLSAHCEITVSEDTLFVVKDLALPPVPATDTLGGASQDAPPRLVADP